LTCNPPAEVKPIYERPKLHKFSCSNTLFELTDRYELTGLIGQGAYGVVWYDYNPS
jgi:hypothetical protein